MRDPEKHAYANGLELSTIDFPLTRRTTPKKMNMKLYVYLFATITLLMVPACDPNNANRKDGVKDAIGARPYEGVRDAAEDTGDAIQDAGRDVRDALNGN
jgi:hypothetical protein